MSGCMKKFMILIVPKVSDISIHPYCLAATLLESTLNKLFKLDVQLSMDIPNINKKKPIHKNL